MRRLVVEFDVPELWEKHLPKIMFGCTKLLADLLVVQE